MPPKKVSLIPHEDISPLEAWALKHCVTDERASAIVDARIKRLTKMFHDSWPEKDEQMRRNQRYKSPIRRFQSIHTGRRHHVRFEEEGDR